MTRSTRFTMPLAFMAIAAMACNDAPTTASPVQLDADASDIRGGAGHGRPVHITACGMTITQPGMYMLASNLTGCAPNGIAIAASNVTLNLQGHTVTFGGGGFGVGLDVKPGSNNVSILGPGTIVGFPLGGQFEGVTNSRMSNVTITQSTFQGFAINKDFNATASVYSTNNQFYDNSFIDNTGHGVTMNGGSGNKFRGNLSAGNQGTGFFMFDANDNDYKDNEARNNAGFGFWTFDGSASGNLIQGNRASGNAWTDAEESGVCDNTWKDNTFGTTSGAVGCIK